MTVEGVDPDTASVGQQCITRHQITFAARSRSGPAIEVHAGAGTRAIESKASGRRGSRPGGGLGAVFYPKSPSPKITLAVCAHQTATRAALSGGSHFRWRAFNQKEPRSEVLNTDDPSAFAATC
jgi:hypothetical protein